ncbi:hypothetical protein RZS08_39350, partial [Arthrospira platensis SPKY1]|nr:hypothetical protein [Arthrospira platensis SPKY1]
MIRLWRRALLFLTLSVATLHNAGAQTSADTLLVLSLDQYLQRSEVEYHPVARQANLFRNQAEAGLRMARGGF